jgi:hypothetical protein
MIGCAFLGVSNRRSLIRGSSPEEEKRFDPAQAENAPISKRPASTVRTSRLDAVLDVVLA